MNFYLQRALDAMESATHGLTREQLATRRNGKWSPAEVLEHLTLAFSSTSKLLGKHLAAGHGATSPRTLRHRIVSALIIGMGYFPAGREAPPFTIPQGVAPEMAVRNFRQALAAMDEMITRCEQRLGAVPLASHFIFGSLTARQWRKFHWVHTRHHMKQIAAVR